MLDRKRETGTHARPYLRNVNIRWGHFDLSEVMTIDFDEREWAEFRLLPGDVLVCEGGEVGRAAVWSGELEECYFFQKALHRLRPDPTRCLPEFLQLQLSVLAKSGQLAEHTTHLTIAHLTGIKLSALRIPLPPLAQQRRIVDILDRTASIRKLRRQAQETARQIIPALFVKMFGDPATNPMGWPSFAFSALGRVQLGRQRAPKYQAGMFTRPYVRIANVFEDAIDASDLP
jgi:type I restriction enzyme S subunit